MDRSLYVPLLVAAKALGVSKNTMRRRLDVAGIQTHLDPLDRRYRLIPREALVGLSMPHDKRSTETVREAAGVNR